MHNNKVSTKTRFGGFTLIEMALSILILGIIFSFLLPIYNDYRRSKVETKTKSNLELAQTALDSFKLEHGHYPCPSSLSAPRTSPNYGTETDCAVTTVAVGACDAGVNYCVQNSPRTALTAAQRRVRVGALPFRVLGMQEKQTYDGWNGKIVYAVMESLTNVTSYNDGRGGIQMLDENAQSVGIIAAQNTYKFVLLSNGANKVGSYTMNGVLGNPCNAAYTAQDRQNCDYLIAGTTAASFATSNQSKSQNAAFFDDVVVYQAADVQNNSEGWRYGQVANAENPSDIMVMGRNVRVGGLAAPTDRLSIQGTLRINDDTNGKMMVNQFCDDAGANCFDVAGLNQTCGPGEYVIGFNAGAPHVKCGPLYFGCPVGNQILAGKNADGSPRCVVTSLPPTPIPPMPGPPPVTCSPGTRVLNIACPTPVGVFYQQTQTIDCLSGLWRNTSNNQSTACCGGTRSQNYVCGDYNDPPNANYPWPQTSSCPSGAWTPTTRPGANPCNCQPSETTTTEPTCADPDTETGDVCNTVTRSYPKTSGRCTTFVDTIITAGSCKAANFTWQGVSPTGTTNPNSTPAITDEGTSCTYGDVPRVCERAVSGGYKLLNCICKKVVTPCH